MRRYVIVISCIALFATSCKNDFQKEFTKSLTNGDKKYWRYFYYNTKGNLINSNRGQCLYKNGKNIYYYYDWNKDSNFTYRILDNFLRFDQSWRLICDSIIVFDNTAYYKIISFNSKEIVLIQLNSNITDGTLILHEESDQRTEIRHPSTDTNQGPSMRM